MASCRRAHHVKRMVARPNARVRTTNSREGKNAAMCQLWKRGSIDSRPSWRKHRQGATLCTAIPTRSPDHQTRLPDDSCNTSDGAASCMPLARPSILLSQDERTIRLAKEFAIRNAIPSPMHTLRRTHELHQTNGSHSGESVSNGRDQRLVYHQHH